MDKGAREYLEAILKAIKTNFFNVEVQDFDFTAKRGYLKVTATYQDFSVSIREVINSKGREYSYYLLSQKNEVILGLDSSPNLHALKLKYGKNFSQHKNEWVPHQHTENKKITELTEEKTIFEFVQMIKSLES